MKKYRLIFIDESGNKIPVDFGTNKRKTESDKIKDIDDYTRQFSDYESLIDSCEVKYNTSIEMIKVDATNLGGTDGLFLKVTEEQYGGINYKNVKGKYEQLLKKDMDKRKKFIDDISHNKEKEYNLDILQEYIDKYFVGITYKSLRDKYFEYINWKEEKLLEKEWAEQEKKGCVKQENIVKNDTTYSVLKALKTKLAWGKGENVHIDLTKDPDQYINEIEKNVGDMYTGQDVGNMRRRSR